MTDTILTDEQIRKASDAQVRNYQNGGTAPSVVLGRAIEQAVLQSPEVQAWKRDAERLDWLADQEAQVQSMNKARGDPVYRIGWPDDGEYRFDWHSSPRAAIDAAMEKQP